MSLGESLQSILYEYLEAITQPFAQHPLANTIRHDLPDAIATVADNAERLLIKGSAGQGNWVKGPWIGIFDRLVTTSAQSGYYPVYLFREDMKGVYLSLNQGMTEAKQIYKSDAKTALRARAANFRAMLGNQTSQFPLLEIDLAPSAASNDTAFYEAGNICAVYYSADQLPDDAQLKTDLTAMIALYEKLVFAQTYGDADNATDGDEPAGLLFEDASKFRFHKRIERNPKIAAEVKKLKGCTCQVCNTDFEAVYGEIGKGYIEAHHLIPVSSLKGKKVAMDPKKDFAVLCSNCHRMIHRSGHVDDIEKFKEQHYKR